MTIPLKVVKSLFPYEIFWNFLAPERDVAGLPKPGAGNVLRKRIWKSVL